MQQTKWLTVCTGTLALASALAVFNPSLTLGQSEGQLMSSQNSLRQTLMAFFNNEEPEDRSRGRNGSSRGGRQVSISQPHDNAFCILTPGRRETLWHQQPLFVLRGNLNRMQLREARESLNQPPKPTLASDPAMPGAGQLVVTQFSDLVLQAGTQYEWVFYDTPTNDPLYVLPFTVMAVGVERDQITADLEQIEMSLRQPGADTEAIAQAKVTYFLEKGMPADALHILFSLVSPSPELATLRDETIEAICSFELVS